ncbi:DUF6323 family protein [Enterococcus sp. HY326]|uniref:DUF6323 family protein n=1 Tax=Enterococcus sp. HY326 TaxID=2971265 RepID=UPI00224038FA|nr:DUF6323 family protein [Enterococcus sp. HY326]
MTENNIMLLNALAGVEEKGQIQIKLNKILQQKYQLTKGETAEILTERDTFLIENQLIDFSFDNLFFMTEVVSTQPLYSKAAFRVQLAGFQEIFYYLRGLENGTVSDEEIVEKISAVSNYFEGDLEFVKGYFEDHPSLDLEDLTDDE